MTTFERRGLPAADSVRSGLRVTSPARGTAARAGRHTTDILNFLNGHAAKIMQTDDMQERMKNTERRRWAAPRILCQTPADRITSGEGHKASGATVIEKPNPSYRGHREHRFSFWFRP